MSTVNEQIGKKIRELRKEKGLTQTAFAELFNTSQNRVTNIETGKSELSFEELLSMANYFDVSTDYILKENGVREKNPELQYICDYTGLSKKTIETLKNMKMRDYSEPIYFKESAVALFTLGEWNFYLNVMERVLINAPIFKAFKDYADALIDYNEQKENENRNSEFFSELSYFEENIDLSLYKIQKSIMKIVENYGTKLFEKEFYNTIKEEILSNTPSNEDWSEICDE